jgi:hypothetical protein
MRIEQVMILARDGVHKSITDLLTYFSKDSKSRHGGETCRVRQITAAKSIEMVALIVGDLNQIHEEIQGLWKICMIPGSQKIDSKKDEKWTLREK